MSLRFLCVSSARILYSLQSTAQNLNLLSFLAQLLQHGIEQWNTRPLRGIAFLQENGLLAIPQDPKQLARLLRCHPQVDRKMLGEFLSARKNADVLRAFREVRAPCV